MISVYDDFYGNVYIILEPSVCFLRDRVSLVTFRASLMWENINPHVLVYVFIPALIFADCLGVGWHLMKRCVTQCLLLAVPGVVLGTAIVAIPLTRAR